jgi:hypothetical protein
MEGKEEVGKCLEEEEVLGGGMDSGRVFAYEFGFCVVVAVG